jgi:putative transposase
MLLSLKNGDQVLYQGQVYTIKAPINLHKLLLIDHKQNTLIAKIKDLSPVGSCSINNNSALDLPKAIPANSLIDLPAKAWEQLMNREQLLHRLVEERSSVKLVKEIAQSLNLKWRQVYNLAKKYKQSGGNLSGVTFRNNQGGRDKSRLLPAVEMLLQDAIAELYCDRQKVKPSIVVEEIKRRCRLAGFKTPSQVTVRKRINHLAKRELVMARSGCKEARSLSSIRGCSFVAEYPLQEVQIDHTKVDLIVVDDLYRQPIGRPYLTVAIDVFSRCITGFCLTLESPSATSVGLCLLHSVFKKDYWLSERKIDGEWLIWGKPELIYVDNGSEFHSEALIRGCEFHGIKLKYRPPGAPHYGGIVERVIGTLMQLVHQIPGTTFSNVQERGSYDSDKRAILTLDELERWLAIAIVNYYHQKIHSSLLMSPIEKYRLGIVGDLNNKGIGYPKVIADQEAFLIDFLPIERRILRREGFVLDHISYYSNTLSPFIHRKNSIQEEFLIRRDPRDLSKIYFLDPQSKSYFEIPYRHLARPTISLWEHRQAVKYLKETGKRQLNEELIFTAIQELRALTKEAATKSKQARRNQERINNNQLISARKINGSLDKLELEEPQGPIEAFSVEIW